MKETYRVGIISDTHGLLREEVINQLKTCDYIIHGGDIDKEEVLDELKNIYSSSSKNVKRVDNLSDVEILRCENKLLKDKYNRLIDSLKTILDNEIK